MQTRLRFRLAVTATALALLPLCAAPASAQDPARIPTISDLAEDLAVQKSCLEILKRGLRPIAEDRTKRFQGKVTRAAAICRGGMKGLAGADKAKNAEQTNTALAEFTKQMRESCKK